MANNESDEFDALVSDLRRISERLGEVNHGSAALLKRSLDQGLRYVPEPAPEPSAAPVLSTQPALEPAQQESIAEIVRREIQAALRGIATTERAQGGGEQV